MKQIVDKLNKIAQAIDESVELPTSDLIIDSLDAITTAFGGTPNDSNLIVDKLDDIASVAHGGTEPTGNIEFTENTTEPVDVSQYATATVNVSGGNNMLKTTLTIVNSTDHLITELPIQMRLDYFLLNNNVVSVPINNDGMLILDSSNMPEIELQSSQTMTLDLYYCVALGSAPSTGIKFASADTYAVSNVINFTYNSDADAYLVTDLTIDSSITVTLT